MQIELVPSNCGHCGVGLEMATGIEEERPGPGDPSICIYCGEWNEFDEELRLRPTSKEMVALKIGPQLEEGVRACVVQSIKERKDGKIQS